MTENNSEANNVIRGRFDVFDFGDSTEPPPPRSFVVGEYIPEGFVSSLYGQPGASKSLLALWFAFHIRLGWDIFGQPVKVGTVLVVDAELDRTTAELRAWQIARGLGLDRPLGGIYYYKLAAPLNSPEELAKVQNIVRRLKPILTVVDSFSASLRGRDSNSADDVTSRFDSLKDLGTVLMIDHTAKSVDVGGRVTALGSQGKMMFTRSALFVASNKDGCLLRHEKHNFSSGADPVGFKWNFSEETVSLDTIASDDPRLKEIGRGLTATERIRAAFMGGEYPDGAKPERIAADLDLSVGTVRNSLGTLKKDGVVRSVAGKYVLVDQTLDLAN